MLSFTNIFPFGGNIPAVGRKRCIWISLSAMVAESQHRIVLGPHINIWVGGPLWMALSLLFAPTESQHSLRRGGSLPIGPRAARRRMYGITLKDVWHYP